MPFSLIIVNGIANQSRLIVILIYSYLRGSPVKKNCNGAPYKRFLLFTFIFLMITGSFISHSYGEEKKVRWGVSVFGGTGDVFYNKADMTVFGFLPRISLPLYKKNWDIEFEGNFFYYDIRKTHDLYFLGLSHNILFKPIQKSWGSLFLLAGAGLGYDSAGKRLTIEDSHVPLMGDQHFAGFFQAGAGMSFNVGRGTALRVEYRLYHLSEPFDTTDRGLNTHTVLFGISF
jgi:hypothetical protein